nr:uroporphyrinogen-III synthase [Thermoleophilaceae bacterium]
YMGVKNLPLIADRLVGAGRPADDPAAVVERGTLPAQRTVTGPLADIAERASDARLKPPALTIVGPVAALREGLAWFEQRPLHGKRVAVTRARAQLSGLARRLELLGAEVVEAPAIRIEPRAPAAELADVSGYGLVCVTSPNGAGLLVDGVRDARVFAGATVAAIGPGTAQALRERGIEADVVPERSIAEALVESLEAVPVEGVRVLIARAAEARDVLPDALRERGAEVDVVALYDTVAEEVEVGPADYVTFTSSSTVKFLPELPEGARTVSIGPVTSATLRERGWPVDVEASQHDVDGLVEALLEDVAE